MVGPALFNLQWRRLGTVHLPSGSNDIWAHAKRSPLQEMSYQLEISIQMRTSLSHFPGPMADHLLSHKCPTPYKQNILTNNSCEDENADKEVDGDKQVFDVLE